MRVRGENGRSGSTGVRRAVTWWGRFVDLEVQPVQCHLDGLRGQGGPGDVQLQLPHKGAPHAHREPQGGALPGQPRTRGRNVSRSVL